MVGVYELHMQALHKSKMSAIEKIIYEYIIPILYYYHASSKKTCYILEKFPNIFQYFQDLYCFHGSLYR